VLGSPILPRKHRFVLTLWTYELSISFLILACLSKPRMRQANLGHVELILLQERQKKKVSAVAFILNVSEA